MINDTLARRDLERRLDCALHEFEDLCENSYFGDRGLTQSDTWYPVIELPQPEGVPSDKIALCIIYGLFQSEYTGEQACSWLIVDPGIVEHRKW